MELQHLKFVQADAAIISANNGDVTGDAIDTQGAHEVAFLFKVYATTGVITVFKIQGSDNGSTGWTDISGATLTTLPGASDDNKNYAVYGDLRARQYRYVRFFLTENNTGTVTGDMTAILNVLNETPSTDAERGLAASNAVVL